jgi:hypothetical protein
LLEKAKMTVFQLAIVEHRPKISNPVAMATESNLTERVINVQYKVTDVSSV